MKRILGIILLLAGGVSGSCPIPAVHESVNVLIRQKVVEIKDGKMRIRRAYIEKMVAFLKASDKNAVEQFLKNLERGFQMYAESHHLEIETAE
ncbi:MAG: hypothetical protein LBQ97_04470 [Fusobacteriaceae bacterium]|jgi:hypothetical protein|nr:hypothetical protein [Fusobacteriaceae bacterium]